MYLLEKQVRMCQAANKLKEFLIIILNAKRAPGDYDDVRI